MAHRTNDPRLSRREALRATAGLGALTAAALTGGPLSRPAYADPSHGSAPGFTAVPVARTDAVTVPPGYTARVLLPWGAPLRADSPPWNPGASDTAEDARLQVGTGHSALQYLPLAPSHEGNRRGALVLGHAGADPVLLHADGGRSATPERTAKEMASLGASVARVDLTDGRWRVMRSDVNRRVTASSPVAFSGPVEGHPDLDTGTDPLGTTGGRAHALTPWGTYLAGEDAIADVFGTADERWSPTEGHQRYGLAADSGYGWHAHEPRFDLARTPNEANRFGWSVEIAPFDPDSPPVKRTALGRLAHTGATVTESRGRAVVYMSDAAHVYKFVTERPWREVRTASVSPLDEGTLYTARFDGDGGGRWLPLVHGRSGLTSGDGFRDQADVLLRARESADAVGATALEGPGRPAVHPDTGTVYCPEAAEAGGGRLLAWSEGAGDHGAALMRWREFARAGRSPDDGGGTAFAAPGGVHCGSDGRLWITTDVTRLEDRDERERLGNSALLCADPGTGEIRRFLTGPRGCGISGVTATPDQRTLFVSVCDPGSSGPRPGEPTPEDPRSVSNWPGFDPEGRPRSAVVAVRREDGGMVGT